MVGPAEWLRYLFVEVVDEGAEPAHIHVRSGEGECKFWLSPIALARNRGIPARQLGEIERLVFENQELLLQKFGEYHGR